MQLPVYGLGKQEEVPAPTQQMNRKLVVASLRSAKLWPLGPHARSFSISPSLCKFVFQIKKKKSSIKDQYVFLNSQAKNLNSFAFLSSPLPGDNHCCQFISLQINFCVFLDICTLRGGCFFFIKIGSYCLYHSSHFLPPLKMSWKLTCQHV